jgi:glycosyltransferase involved in cell wall biosynthesis
MQPPFAVPRFAARVLVVCEYPTLNGGERSFLSVLPGVTRAGFEIEVACPVQGDLADALRAMGVVVHDWRKPADVAAILRDRRPGLVHVNGLAAARKVADVAAGCGVPAIAHLRDIVGVGADGVRRLHRYDRLLAVSAATRDFHVAQGLPADRSIVVYNGVDGERFRPRAATGWLHRRLGLDADAQLVGVIGQLGQRKGQDVVAAAARLLADRWPRAHYIFAGERNSQKQEVREYEANLQEVFENGLLAGRGSFVGRIDSIEEFLPELSLLAHPARQEPLGRVLLEAGAAGAPIVASDVGGTREIFPREEFACLLTPAGDAAALAAAIDRLFANGPEAAAMAARARRIVAERFTIEQAVAGLVEAYRSVRAGGEDATGEG